MEHKTKPSSVQGGLDQAELFDYTNYPEKWAFTTRRHKGKLVAKGVGWYAATHQTMYECEFEYRKDGWILNQLVDYETGEKCEVMEDVKRDMFREFAYHKARWLKEKEKKRELQGELTRSVRKLR